jgi:hypothetical protein
MQRGGVPSAAGELMLAQSLTFFAQNIYLLIGLVFVAGVLAVLVFVGWTAARTGLFVHRRREAEREAEAAKIGPDGRPYPPAAEGLCDRCQRAFNRVYYVPNGPRLCPACYAVEHPAPQPAE